MKNQIKKQSYVLVGEDDPFFTKVYTLKFEKAGFEIKIARDGDELLKLARERKPDLILLDLVMPGKNGFETLQEIRTDQKLKNIAVLITSSLEQEEDKRRVTKLGVSGFFNKSNIQEVVETATKLISHL